jgi:hypothetical protein
MGPRSVLREGAVQHPAAFQRVRALGGFAGREVPHLPGCAVHHRLDENAGDLLIVGMGGVGVAHGVRKGIVPWAHVLGRAVLRVAAQQRLEKSAFGRGHPIEQLHRLVRRIPRHLQCRRLPIGVHPPPRHVVVRAGGVGDSPPRHGAIRIGLRRALETAHGLFMVVAEGPVQAAVEPGLRLGAPCGDLPRICAEIVWICTHDRFSPCSRIPTSRGTSGGA